MLLASGLLLGVLFGYAFGGRLHHLENARLRFDGLAIALVAVQFVVLGLASRGVGTAGFPAVWSAALCLLAGVCVVNWHQPGIAVAGLGISLNLAVIAVNGAMPVDIGVAAALGPAQEAAVIARLAADPLHVALDAGTRLAALADRFAAPGPPGIRGVFSIGDVLLASGIGYFAFRSMGIGRMHRRRPE